MAKTKAVRSALLSIVGLVLLAGLGVACQTKRQVPVAQPTPSRQIIAMASVPAEERTPPSYRTQTARVATRLATQGPALTAAALNTPEPQITLTLGITSTVVLSPTNTIVVNSTLQSQYESPFPLPDQVQNFTKFGDVKISFQTDLGLDEVIHFYRGAFNLENLVEIESLAYTSEDSFSLVFSGSMNKMLIYVTGQLLEGDLVEVNVYYGF